MNNNNLNALKTRSFAMIFVDEFLKTHAIFSNNLSGGTFGKCHVPNVENISIKFNKGIMYVFIDLKFFKF